MQNSFTQKIAQFSLLSATVNLWSSFVTYPLSKMNIRRKAGELATTKQGLIMEIKNFRKVEGIRGIFQGAALLPASVITINFLQNFVYQKLIHHCKRQDLFKNNSTLMGFLPLMSVVAVTPISYISSMFSMVFSIIHSQKLSNYEAIKQALKKDKKIFYESFKLTVFNTFLLLGTRQFIYQHVSKKLRDHKVHPYLNLILTSSTVGLAVGLIYQPFQVILTLLAVGQKKSHTNNISSIIKKEGFLNILTKGLKFRILISMIISMTAMPLYSYLKQQFDLNLYQ